MATSVGTNANRSRLGISPCLPSAYPAPWPEVAAITRPAHRSAQRRDQAIERARQLGQRRGEAQPQPALAGWTERRARRQADLDALDQLDGVGEAVGHPVDLEERI